MSNIRYDQVDKQEFEGIFVTRDELIEGTFNDENLSLVYASKEIDGSELDHSNIIIQDAKRELFGFRRPFTEYKLGEVAYCTTLPNYYRLECVVAGTSNYLEDSAIVDFANATVGDIITDGSVKWIVDDIRDGVLPGDVVFRYYVRDGYLAADGSDYEIDKYIRLYNFAVKYNLLLEDTATWSNGKQGLFCKVDDTHFRVPDLRGVFVRALDSGKGYDPDREVGTYQSGTIVGGNDSDAEGANHSIVLNHKYNNSFDDPTNYKDEYHMTDVSYAYSHRLNHIDWASSAANYYGIARPRNVAMIAQIKY